VGHGQAVRRGPQPPALASVCEQRRDDLCHPGRVVRHQRLRRRVEREAVCRGGRHRYRRADGPRLEDFVLDPSPGPHGCDGHPRLLEHGTHVRHLAQHVDARSVGQLVHLGGRIPAGDHKPRIRHALSHPRQHIVGEVAHRIDVGRIRHHSGEGDRRLRGLVGRGAQGLDHDAVGHYVHVLPTRDAAQRCGVLRPGHDARVKGPHVAAFVAQLMHECAEAPDLEPERLGQAQLSPGRERHAVDPVQHRGREVLPADRRELGAAPHQCRVPSAVGEDRIHRCSEWPFIHLPTRARACGVGTQRHESLDPQLARLLGIAFSSLGSHKRDAPFVSQTAQQVGCPQREAVPPVPDGHAGHGEQARARAGLAAGHPASAYRRS
jgi:hypothetical protein